MAFLKKTILVDEMLYERVRGEAFLSNKKIKDVVNGILVDYFDRNPEKGVIGKPGHLDTIMKVAEIRGIKEALKSSASKVEAAEKLGITKQWLHKKIKEYGIKDDQ